MEESKIRELIEEIDPDNKISEDKTQDFITAINEQEKNPIKPGTVIDGITFDILTKEMELKEEMKIEPDWKKKMAIAAQIISLNL